MSKTAYVKDVKENDRVDSLFTLTRKQLLTLKATNKPFLALVLHDKTGELEARVWDEAAAVDARIEAGDIVHAVGTVVLHKEKPQLKLERIEKAELGTVDAAELALPPKPERTERPAPSGPRLPPHSEERFGQVAALIDRVADPHVRALLKSFIDDEELAPLLKRAPAAKSIHHAQPGGLIEHLLSCMRLAHRLCDHYPMVDRDLVLAGAFLHDLGKVKELKFDGATEYSDEGRLVGHLVMTTHWIHDRARAIEGFPPLLEQHLIHIVLAHHGQLDYGSPKTPMTLEALLVHTLDELDSRVNSWLGTMARDPGDNWTAFDKMYDRHLWKGPAPTVNGRRPVERRSKKGGDSKGHEKGHEKHEHKGGERHESKGHDKHESKGHDHKAEGSSAEAPAAERKPHGHEPREGRPQGERRPERPPRERRDGPPSERPPREARPPREPREPRPASGDAKLTFKPFAAIALGEPESEPTTDAPAEPKSEAPSAEG